MKIRIGRLGRDATREALRRPFANHEIRLDGDALDRMTRESQLYPYFIQLLGSLVWRRVSALGERAGVTVETVEAALPEFGRERRDFYRLRAEELIERDLLPVGRAVAEAFRERSRLTDSQLSAAVATALPEAGPATAQRKAVRTVADLGLVWRSTGRLDWEPGIPSLMDYLRKHAAA